MQYIIMFTLVVIAAIFDVITGMLKARITGMGYDSTIMRKGLYCKAVNIATMLFAIVAEIGMEALGRYYAQEQLAQIAGSITAGFVFAVIIIMESISIAENFALANPKSPFARVLAKRLRKLQCEMLGNDSGDTESEEKATEKKEK